MSTCDPGRATLIVVRHGETSANLSGVWHGSTDTPLTERGRAQAARVAAFLAEAYADATAVYTSGMLPDSTSAMAWPPPLYGTCSSFAPVRWASISPAMCGVPPMPDVP